METISFSAFSVISSDPLSEDNVRQQSLFAFFIVWNIFTKTFKDIYAENLMIVDRWCFWCHQGIKVFLLLTTREIICTLSDESRGNQSQDDWVLSKERPSGWFADEWELPASDRGKSWWKYHLRSSQRRESCCIPERGVRRQINGDYSPQTSQGHWSRGGFMAGH